MADMKIKLQQMGFSGGGGGSSTGDNYDDDDDDDDSNSTFMVMGNVSKERQLH